MTETMAFRTLLRVYFLFKSKPLSTNIKLTLQKPLVWSITTYACPARKIVADIHLLKFQHLQNKGFCTASKFVRNTSICSVHAAFKILYIQDFITVFCRQLSEVK
jgi:hypothetical protein